MTAAPAGYRQIRVPCGCGRAVWFVTWTGAEHLPMKVRCGCGRIITQTEALAYEKRNPNQEGN